MPLKISTNVCCEFSIEMVLVVPYAYWLFKHGLLENTISAKDTQALYFFSENHEERYDARAISMEKSGITGNIPNSWIHHNSKAILGKEYSELTLEEQIKVNGKLDFTQWEFPPFKEYYKNDLFVFEKPLLIISNKYAAEWRQNPINYLDISILQELFRMLHGRYTIIYRRALNGDHPIDENEQEFNGDIRANIPEIGDLTDHEYCKLVGITTFQDIMKEYPTLTYNQVQFLLYANCDNYISVQGGNGTICSAFGKKNINYIKEGKESRPGYMDEDSFYHKMNGCKNILVRNYQELIEKVKSEYL